jgi:hypothetical protein
MPKASIGATAISVAVPFSITLTAEYCNIQLRMADTAGKTQ